MREEPEIVKILRKEEMLREKHENQEREKKFLSKSDTHDIIDHGECKEKGLKKNKGFDRKHIDLFETAVDPIIILDKNGLFIDINQQGIKLLGYSKEELVGKHFAEVGILTEESMNKTIENFAKRMNGENIPIYEIEVISKNGEIIPAEINANAIYENGEIIGDLVILRDIRQRKNAEYMLRESEERYRTLFNNAADGIIILDIYGQIQSLNKRFEEETGYNLEELIGKEFVTSGLLDKENATKFSEYIKKLLSNTEIISFEIECINRDGKKIPYEVRAAPIKRGDKIVEIQAIFRDLRERRKVEEQLVRSEKKFRNIFDATSDLLLYVDIEGNVLDVNKTVLETLNLKKDEIIGKKFYELKDLFFPDHVKECFKDNCFKSMRKYEGELVTKWGMKRRFLFVNDFIHENGEIKCILIKGRDITEQQKAWEEIVKSEEKYRILAETSADGVFTTDVLGRLTYVNPALEKILGRRKSQILATLFRNYLSRESVYLFQQTFIEARRTGKKIENVELEVVHSDGYVIPIEVNVAPLKKDDRFVGIECTVRDITERKKVERELRKSEQLKTEFMNIAAHELKSPITPIKGYLELILSDKDASSRIKKWAKISLRNAKRLLRLVNDILDVSRLDTDTMRFNMEKIDPVELLNDVVEDMKPSVEKKNLQFIVEIPRDLPYVVGDKIRLSQVLKNLLINAIKFTENGYIAVRARSEEGYLLISVEDTGIGISRDEFKKIFTKFYQAYTGDDRRSEGAGLGLFICREIVKKHGGDILVESEVGKGSVFTVKLPV
ncbi:MAG: hypothetical protein DRN08_00940 [Thermoplasmata archaeon]|nr:MAG: hypothetical protein DRN08_00940 [Thermoplasmata archaeon]